MLAQAATRASRNARCCSSAAALVAASSEASSASAADLAAVKSISAWASASDSGSVARQPPRNRSEEHTSELQSLMRISYAVFCLKTKHTHTSRTHHQQTNKKPDRIR